MLAPVFDGLGGTTADRMADNSAADEILLAIPSDDTTPSEAGVQVFVSVGPTLVIPSDDTTPSEEGPARIDRGPALPGNAPPMYASNMSTLRGYRTKDLSLPANASFTTPMIRRHRMDLFRDEHRILRPWAKVSRARG